MLSLPLTSLAALACGLLLLALTIRVVILRRRGGVVLGDGDDRALAKAIRGQANAAEQMPMALILAGLIELQAGPSIMLGVTLALFLVGRLLHGAYFAFHGLTWRLRFFGMWATVIGQALLLVLLALTTFAYGV